MRDADGLALSSRNGYLTAEQRRIAPQLYKVLRELGDRIRAVGTIPEDGEADALEQLRRAGFQPEYVHVRRQQDLAPARAGDRALAILAAAKLGNTRLIDNLEVELSSN